MKTPDQNISFLGTPMLIARVWNFRAWVVVATDGYGRKQSNLESNYVAGNQTIHCRRLEGLVVLLHQEVALALPRIPG